jgi:long-chain acyl-CoA synthetase
VPTIYVALNGLPENKIPNLSTVRACISGGAPPLEVRSCSEARTGAKVVEGYGLSETSPIIACNPLGGPVKDNSCGPRFSGTVLEIRDVDDPTRVLEQGERGEVCARGPQVMKGYWQRDAETQAVFVDGALRTGDIGYVDEDGYLFLVDRIKDIIFCGGYNVYPRVIEEAAYQHPAVKEASRSEFRMPIADNRLNCLSLSARMKPFRRGTEGVPWRAPQQDRDAKSDRGPREPAQNADRKAFQKELIEEENSKL